MKDPVATVLGGIGIVAFLISGWRVLDSRVPMTSPAEPAVMVQAKAPAGEATAARPAESVPAKRSMAAVQGGDAPLVKEKALAEKLYVQLVSSESGALAVNKSTIALLRLTPNQAHELNVSLAKFLEQLRAEEVKNAYVRVKGDGSQEVVVAPFDRGLLLKKFRDAVAARPGADVGDFCAPEALYDSTLAVGNKEVHIYALRGLTEVEAETAKSGPPGAFRRSMQDRERLMVSRGVHRRNSTGRPEWEGEAAPPMESTLSNTDDYGPRYRHLREAKSRLPRKPE